MVLLAVRWRSAWALEEMAAEDEEAERLRLEEEERERQRLWAEEQVRWLSLSTS